MKSIVKVLFISILISSNSVLSQSISMGERYNFNSKILNEERSYQIYLPPSYYSHQNAKFPVLYLLDGDYNFHYDTGLVEFLSNTAFTIPEMIVIGISDKGSIKQLANSDPKKKADTFIQFINKELKPLINKTYRTTGLDILAGHSKFGIFATHYWMTQPSDFNVFLAIDPSYWFNEYEIVKRLETELQNGLNPESKLFIAQANTQGMGIDELVTVLNKEATEKKNWQINQYSNDNHGSLHLKAITDVLNTMFIGWDLDRKTFYTLENANDVIGYYKKVKDKYNSEFLLPWYSLSNIIYFYSRKERHEDLKLLEVGIKTHFPGSILDYKILLANEYLNNKKIEEAKKLYKNTLKINPESYKALEGLSKIAFLKEDSKTAITHLEKALKIAKTQKIRQYYVNELESTLEALKQ